MDTPIQTLRKQSLVYNKLYTMRIHSLLPPTSFQSTQNGQWYIVTTDPKLGWVRVDRYYQWAELEKMWVRYQFKKVEKNAVLLPKSKPKQTVKPQIFSIEGSRGNVYSVTNNVGVWDCSCPAYGFGRGRDCKHIVKLKNNLN